MHLLHMSPLQLYSLATYAQTYTHILGYRCTHTAHTSHDTHMYESHTHTAHTLEPIALHSYQRVFSFSISSTYCPQLPWPLWPP